MNIDIDFNRLFTTIFSKSEIKLLVLPIDRAYQKGTSDFFERLKKGFKYGDVTCRLPAGLDEKFDINVKSTTYILLGNENLIREYETKGRVCFIGERPEALMLIWEIRSHYGVFYVLNDIKKVDSHIIRIPGYEDSKQRDNSIS